MEFPFRRQKKSDPAPPQSVVAPAPVQPEASPFDEVRLKAMEEALRTLPIPNEGARDYLEKHIPRLARTLTLVPEPQSTGRVLELGCYMQITPFLERICGYTEVRGAYYGPVGRIDHKVVSFPDRDFHCDVDHFDAERDTYPYPDEHFDLVVAGELIEHLVENPMHLLLECRRILKDRGYLLLTTPNIASLISVKKLLRGKVGPQIFPHYKRPDGEPEPGHRREYTLSELAELVSAGGFEAQRLFTTVIGDYEGTWRTTMLAFLAEHGYETANRGEQSWCLARKNVSLPVESFPPVVFG